MRTSIYRQGVFFICPSICLLLQLYWLRENDKDTESDCCTGCSLVGTTTTCFLQWKEGHVERIAASTWWVLRIVPRTCSLTAVEIPMLILLCATWIIVNIHIVLSIPKLNVAPSCMPLKLESLSSG